MKRVLILSLSILLFFACKNNTSSNDISADSVYHLPSQWENQAGQKMKMADLKGKVVVMVMIYSTCKTACPILTSEMGEIASRLADVSPKDIRFVMVSIDPQTDTPERMTAYLKKNNF
ncbi:MAG: SCO family protein, partial [Chitinophagales bacterium]|nr:SCO family protein [Chitinophagales bacterium]